MAECVTLETLEERGIAAALDPVRLLGFRFVFADEATARAVSNGSPLRASECAVFERRRATVAAELCACTAGVRQSDKPLMSGEVISVIAENKLVALYEYDETRRALMPRCVFALGVSRGRDS